MQVKGDGDMLSKSIEEEYGQNLVIRRKSETLLSQTDNKYERQMQNSVERKNMRKKHSDVILSKVNEELMSKASNEHMEFHVFQSNDMFVNADCGNEKLSCEDNVTEGYHISNGCCKHAYFEVSKDGQFSKEITEIDEDCEPIYDDEYFSEEDSLELLQQKKCIDVLLDGREV